MNFTNMRALLITLLTTIALSFVFTAMPTTAICCKDNNTGAW